MTNYKIELEIYEGEGGQLRKRGEEIIYPDVVKEPNLFAAPIQPLPGLW